MGKAKKRSKLAQRRQTAKKLQKKGAKKANCGDSKAIQKIQPLLEKIESGSPNDKCMALNGITMMCDQSPEIREAVLKSGLIEKVMTRLIHDDNNDIVVDSYGLLRNLMIDEGYGLCMHLWRSDLWTSLQDSFNKAKESFGHLKEEKSSVRKELLVNYIDNLLGCTDSLSTETELLDDSILPKLQEDGVLDMVFELVASGPAPLQRAALEFIYDLATVSYKFVELIAGNEQYMAKLNSALDDPNMARLAKSYLLGILLQVMEFNGDVDDDVKLQQLLTRLTQVYKEIDVQKTIQKLSAPYKEMSDLEKQQLDTAQADFHTIELLLDLFTSAIEIVGSSSKASAKSAGFFNEEVQKILVELFEAGVTSHKLLNCLNNLLLLNDSLELQDDQLSQFAEAAQQKEMQRLVEILDEPVSQANVDEINDILALYSSSNEPNVQLVDKLIKLSEEVSNSIDSNQVDTSSLQELNKFVIPYLAQVAKTNEEATAQIVKFIVDEKLIKYLNSYQTFKTAQMAHKKLGFLIEETLYSVINALFEVFDDDYSYNREIFHEQGLLSLLEEKTPELKRIYKAIDKNVEPELKARIEETVNNLDRFIEYKRSEIA